MVHHAIHPIIAKSVLQSHSNPDFQILGLVRIKLWIPKQRRFSLIPSVFKLEVEVSKRRAGRGWLASLKLSEHPSFTHLQPDFSHMRDPWSASSFSYDAGMSAMAFQARPNRLH
jgi:hypothetical protein